jgi:hypothetical protein
MNTIATDSVLSTEMIGAMMNNESGRYDDAKSAAMLKMMQNNPTMMQSMMTGMMETFKK